MRVAAKAFDSDVVVELVGIVSSHVSLLVLELRVTRCGMLELGQLFLLSLALVLLLVRVLFVILADNWDELAVGESASSIPFRNVLLAVFDVRGIHLTTLVSIPAI